MQVKVKLGNGYEWLIIALLTAAGWLMPITIAAVMGEDMRLFFPDIGIILNMIISTLIITLAAAGGVALLYAKLKYYFVLSEKSLTIKLSRFMMNEISYENIISLEAKNNSRIEMIYLLKKKRKIKMQFKTENQEEFVRQLEERVKVKETK